MTLLNINGLNVATVYVTDLEKALSFYTEILGFEKTRDMPPGVLLHSKGADLNLYLQGGRELRESPGEKFPLVTVCFNVKEGVRSAFEKMQQADVPILTKYGDFNSEFAGFQFKDPSGNVFEIAGKP